MSGVSLQRQPRSFTVFDECKAGGEPGEDE